MKYSEVFAFIPLAVLSLVGVGIFVFPIALVVISGAAGNSEDNRDPMKREEMVRVSLLWGRLAPFPESATKFTIRTEGTMFTRTFIGSFSDSPENIQKWMDASPGILEGQKKDSDTYLLKMGEGAQSGEVILSPDRTRVRFLISWS